MDRSVEEEKGDVMKEEGSDDGDYTGSGNKDVKDESMKTVEKQLKAPKEETDVAAEDEGTAMEEGTEEHETKQNSDEGNKKEGTVKKEAKALLDSPVVIEGKRVRRAVNRLVTSTTPVIRKTEASGDGTPLGDIEYVNACIGKQLSNSLKGLHRLCFGTLGTGTSRKRDLRKFNGFSFGEDSEEFKRKKALAMKLTTAEVRSIRQLLGAEGGGTKEELVMSVLHFLAKPEDHGKKAPTATKRRSSAGGQKKREKKPKKEKGGKKSEKKKKKGKKVASESNESEDDVSMSGDDDDEKEEVEKEQSPDKGEAGSAENEETPKDSEKIHADSTSDITAKASTNWGEGGPTEEEMDKAIDELLHSVDLVKFTMKQMCQKGENPSGGGLDEDEVSRAVDKIAEKFPGLKMPIYKAALKERVKMALERLDA